MSLWVKFYRDIMEWEHYTDINTFKLFFHFIISANGKDKKYMNQLVPRGSLIIKERNIGREIGLEYQEVRTALKKLLDSGEIKKKTTNKYTLITVVNYNKYQGVYEEEQRTVNAQLTHKQRTINALSTHIDNRKIESKKERRNNTPLPPFGEYGFGPMLEGKIQQWIEYKTEKGQRYKPQGLRSLLTQIQKKSSEFGEDTVVELIDECMANNWQGIIWDRLVKAEKERIESGKSLPKAAQGLANWIANNGLED